jgi:DNA-directed RNA polymerase subunit RPC12/RpoP
VATEIVFLCLYRCPRCASVLQVAEAPTGGWFRCPRCGRPALPPERGIGRDWHQSDSTRSHLSGRSGHELLWLPDVPEAKPPIRKVGSRWLVTAAFLGLPPVVALMLGQELMEAGLLGLIMALALAMLGRPAKNRGR